MYKVPQDVEAEDKLLGPFSFRQFIYLIVAALAIFLAYGLSRLFIGLALVPLPIILFFLVLALPLKKDQPMETYLTAIIHFLLKPRRRIWDPEGDISHVEITAAHTDEGPALKEFSGHEASERLRYLSQIVDTGGWASRGLTSPMDNLNLADTVVAEASGAEDILDNNASVAQNFDTMITRSDEARKQAMLSAMQNDIQAQAAPQLPTPAPVASQTVVPTQQLYHIPAEPPQPEHPSAIPSTLPPQNTFGQNAHVSFNPYPSSIHQRVIAPGGAPEAPHISHQTPVPPVPQQAQAPSEDPIPPDIMRLATSKDLSISTIAREAERLQKKHDEENEVVISLR